MINGAVLHDLLRDEGLYRDPTNLPFGALPHHERDALQRAAERLNFLVRERGIAPRTYPDPVTTPPAAPTVEGTNVTRDVGR